VLDESIEAFVPEESVVSLGFDEPVVSFELEVSVVVVSFVELLD